MKLEVKKMLVDFLFLLQSTADQFGQRNSNDKSTDQLKYQVQQQLASSHSSVPTVNGRYVCSQRSCRLQLPMDLRLLETLTPREYLLSHCKISSRRRALYKKLFTRHADKSGSIPVQNLYKALQDIHYGAVTQNDVKDICEMLLLDDTSSLDLETFSITAAIVERLLYPKFRVEHTMKDVEQYGREQLERADFYSLNNKLEGIHINDSMMKLIHTLF